ncbi:MAG: leucine-rich repeat domain-containing protein [Chloroflexi bacterium]|nr:leucine-rich repeat domain-containing protein [Chloroflexota bacterium]
MKAIAVGAITIAILISVSAVTVSLVSGQSESLCADSTAVATSTPSLIGDCDNLLRMKSDLRGTAQLNWWTGRSIAQWDGVSVQGGRVDEVSLANNALDGVVPARMGSLSALTTLDLSSNSLTGGIPSSLGNLTNLESLELSSNSLSGQIPESLNRLTKLSRLRLSGNDFTGCMPANLLGVADGDAASLNLPTCGNGTPISTATPVSTSTPTPTPIPTATPTPTTGERLTTIEDRLSDIDTRLRAVETAVATPSSQ